MKRKKKKNSIRTTSIIAFWIAITALFFIISKKTWQQYSYPTKSSSWPFKDLTSGEYATCFDGIDISRHQGKIHWQEIKDNTSLTFVYVKATEGSSIKDPYYNENIKKARRQGLKVGSYHFLTSYTTMKRQATLFLNTIDTQWQDLLPMVDIEEDGTKQWKRNTIQKNLAKFISIIKKKTGKAPIIYTSEKYYLKNLYPEFNKYQLFIANYTKEPSLKDAQYDIWQSSKHARVHGIWNWTDINHLRKGITLKKIYW